MGYRVDIGIGSQFFNTFLSAHESLVKKYAYLNPSRKKLRELWEQVYGVIIVIDTESPYHHWKVAEFDNEQDYLAFVLKWAK